MIRDRLENFNLQVRNKGGFNPNLNFTQFVSNVRSLSIAKSIKVTGGNSLDDECFNLLGEVASIDDEQDKNFSTDNLKVTE